MKRFIKVATIGNYANGQMLADGQIVKTQIVTEELRRQLGDDEVQSFDTCGGKKTIFRAPYQAIMALKKAKNVVIFPAHNGVRVYAPMLVFLRKFYKGRKLHYVVIGGWLPKFLTNRKRLATALKKFDGIYVETNTMKNALEAQGFSNMFIMPNCKNLTVLSEQDFVYPEGIPYRLCTFSRVLKEKGIGTAVDAVKVVNEQLGYVAFTLDIYGSVDPTQVEWFEKLKESFPPYVRYCGCADADKSVEVLRDYFALLFPTHYYTEGIPGTIIDAYAAGIPVISTKWENYADIVNEGKTGVGYEFDNRKQLETVLINVAHNPKNLMTMKINCVKKATDYISKEAVEILTNKMKNVGSSR